jgi:hypothetical protein
MDSSRLPIPNPSVEIVNPAIGYMRNTPVDVNGQFRASGLPVGNYELHASAPGFSTYTQTGINLAMDQTVRLTVELVPAQVQAAITVTTLPSALDVAQTSVTSVMIVLRKRFRCEV